MIDSILVANRGEIAVRLIRAYRELGIRTVAVYSDADADALHVRLADTARRVGPAAVGESYLNIDALIGAAKDTGADAVDPGYGLLSENSHFAEKVSDAGLVFIGPSHDVIARMGDKVAAREAASQSSVPIIPGSEGVVAGIEAAKEVASRLGYPLIVKSSFGGGGRGMRIVDDADGLDAALDAAASESRAAFGRPEVFLERHVSGARHVEVQIIADAHGNIVHLGDRDCSVQRRHQKLIEEAPAPFLSDATRAEIAQASIRLAREVGYTSTGTVEFLYDPASDEVYFLEMNTRLQVEHGVTELVTGIDIVAARLAVARGLALPFEQKDVRISGHSIEVRLSAEDPRRNFMPTPGAIDFLHVPAGPWLRADFAVAQHDSVSREYDSMFGKLMAWGPDRDTARERLISALSELRIVGIDSTAAYSARILGTPEFVAGSHTTTSVDDLWQGHLDVGPTKDEPPQQVAVGSARSDATITSRAVEIELINGTVALTIYGLGDAAASVARKSTPRSARVGGSALPVSDRQPAAPMDGVVVSVQVAVGDTVSEGTVLAHVEAMKMQMPITATFDGVVSAVAAVVGDSVVAGQSIVKLESVTETASQ